METQFGHIFNLRYRRAKKRENSSYLEELTSLLANASERIDSDDSYFFDNEFYLNSNSMRPNASYEEFIKSLKRSFEHGYRKKMTIIRGKAGIGKTLFFEKGMQRLISKQNNGKKYIHMGVDFKNIDNDKNIEFYETKIYQQLNNNAIDNIRYLGQDIQNTFKEEYDAFGKDHNTPDTYLFPLKYFCEKINALYGKPCVIVFDNIDLSSVKTQKNVFRATTNVFDKFNKFMNYSENPDCYRIYFTMRPETELYSNEAKLGDAINFPLPNLLKIFLAIINKVLLKTAEEFDEIQDMKCNITCKNILNVNSMITFNNYTDVAKYFCEILNYYLTDIWDDRVNNRLGTCEEFPLQNR